MNQENRDQLPQPVTYYPYMQTDDEISLVDIWVSLSRYRMLFFKAFLGFLALGLLFALLVFKEKYALMTTVQIGTYEKDNRVIPIESPDSLLSKINNSMVPKYTHQWLIENGYENIFETQASTPKGSNIILISNKVREDEIDLFSGFQATLAGMVLEDHQRIIRSLQAELKSKLELARLSLQKLQTPLTLNILLKQSQIKLDAEKIKLQKLEDEKFFGIRKNEFQNSILAEQHELQGLQDSGEVLKNQLKSRDETKQILSRNINELSGQILSANNTKKQAAENATELSAMSQLLINNDIQQNQNRLLSLEERYYVTVENEKAELLNKIETNRLQQIDATRRIGVLQQKYDQLLLDNQLQVEQQKLAIEKAQLDLQKIRLEHEDAISQQLQNINEIETRLDNYNETRIVSPAVPSLKPSGLTRKLLIIISIVLAAFAGFIVVLLALFSDKVKQRKLELADNT